MMLNKWVDGWRTREEEDSGRGGGNIALSRDLLGMFFEVRGFRGVLLPSPWRSTADKGP